MPGSGLGVITPVALVALGGFLLGAYFGLPWIGLALALALLLAFHLYRLVELEHALSERREISVPDGDGIWPRVLAGIRYQQQRVRRHKGRHRQLMKELRQSTNALPDGVITLTSDNEIQRYNAAAQMLVGLRRRRDRGQRVDNLIRHPDFLEYLQGDDYQQPLVIPSTVREDGWLSLHIVPYSSDSRLLIIRDVTERTRLSRMRRDFVANASHELRTPLTVISGYLDAMTDDAELAAGWGKPLLEMNTQATRMRQLLDELLSLSQLEISVDASRDELVDMAALARECSRMHGGGARQVELQLDASIGVYGELSDLTSVVTNLLTNALRYSDADTPITIRWRQLAKGGAELSMIDKGEGIADEDIPRLTERFFRVNRGRGRDSGGVGLGLAIVKHALARHEATLDIDSELGRGSCFSCRFPRDRIGSLPLKAQVHQLQSKQARPGNA